MEEFQASQWRNKYPEIPLLKDYVMLCTSRQEGATLSLRLENLDSMICGRSFVESFEQALDL